MKTYSKIVTGNCYVYAIMQWMRHPIRRRIVLQWRHKWYPHASVKEGRLIQDFTYSGIPVPMQRRYLFCLWREGRIRTQDGVPNEHTFFRCWPFDLRCKTAGWDRTKEGTNIE